MHKNLNIFDSSRFTRSLARSLGQRKRSWTAARRKQNFSPLAPFKSSDAAWCLPFLPSTMFIDYCVSLCFGLAQKRKHQTSIEINGLKQKKTKKNNKRKGEWELTCSITYFNSLGPFTSLSLADCLSDGLFLRDPKWWIPRASPGHD